MARDCPCPPSQFVTVPPSVICSHLLGNGQKGVGTCALLYKWPTILLICQCTRNNHSSPWTVELQTPQLCYLSDDHYFVWLQAVCDLCCRETFKLELSMSQS